MPHAQDRARARAVTLGEAETAGGVGDKVAAGAVTVWSPVQHTINRYWLNN